MHTTRPLRPQDLLAYSAFLPVHLRGQHLPLVDELMQQFLSHVARERVRAILSILRGKSMTTKGKLRNERIILRLFENKHK